MQCEMSEACASPVAYIDAKGFIYCETHGKQRQRDQNCRKLRQYEINRLSRGLTLAHY